LGLLIRSLEIPRGVGIRGQKFWRKNLKGYIVNYLCVFTPIVRFGFLAGFLVWLHHKRNTGRVEIVLGKHWASWGYQTEKEMDMKTFFGIDETKRQSGKSNGLKTICLNGDDKRKRFIRF